MQTIATGDGRRLALETLGDAPGPPVLVLPGGPCRGPEYLGDLAGLPAARRLAVVHPRGTTATGGLSRGWWRDADDLPAVVAHLGGAPLDVLAHSAGTRLALAFVARFPGQVRSLTLVTPPATWLTGAPHDGADLVAARRDPVVDAAWAAMDSAGDAEDEAAFQRALAVTAPAGYAAWTDVEQAHARVGRSTLAAARAWFRDVPPDAPARILRAVRPPTCVVAGRQDVLTGRTPVEACAGALGAGLVALDRCGHYPWVEQPAAFRDAVLRWWTAQGPTGPAVPPAPPDARGVGPAGLEPTTSAV